jgi:hypothetical protein
MGLHRPIVLVLVVVLDCFPRRADRGGRRRPRGRLGKIPPLFRARPRRRARLFPRRADRGRRRPRARLGKIPPLLFSCSSSSSCSIAFLAGQNEHEHDHEHDLEKSRRFFFCARPRRHARLLSSPDRTRTTASTSTSTIEERASPL